jgi:hypothetical protein
MKNYATRYTYLDKEKEHTPKEQKEKMKTGEIKEKKRENVEELAPCCFGDTLS